MTLQKEWWVYMMGLKDWNTGWGFKLDAISQSPLVIKFKAVDKQNAAHTVTAV